MSPPIYRRKNYRNPYYRRLRRLRKNLLHWLKLGSYQCSKRYRGSCRNLMADDAMIWRFMDDSECPLTDNAAERVLRNYILMRKSCYVIRSSRGDQFRERMFSQIETARARLRSLLPFKDLR
ncbi:IS66 family transposase [Vibrio alginolyticus]|uniref:IS66 family transposase n=1 Tax=Vibrio alginolyticus TaxID=663 RepID=UPI002893258D|nr:transposase [Vibrio alginolyticus]